MKPENSSLHYLIIIAAVILVNLVGVFGLDSLIQDDNSRFMTVVTDGYKYDYPWRSFLGLRSDVMWFLMGVVAHSAYLARLLVLLCFMVPLSLLFYRFNMRVLGVCPWVALGSAIIVQSIPALYEFPAFIEGSYPAWGLLPFMVSLLLAHRYVQSCGTQAALLAVWVLCWVLANDLMVEMGIFLYPALIYFLYTIPGNSGKKWALYVFSSIVVILRLLVYLSTYGHPTNSVSGTSPANFTNRISQSIEWWLPVQVDLGFTTLSVLVLAALGAALYFRRALVARLDDRSRRALVFYGLWFLATSIPFWFLSTNFAPRYFYVAYFGLTSIVLILLDRLWIHRYRHARPVAFVLLVLLLGTYGLDRYWQIDERFSRWNAAMQSVYDTLANETLEPGVQLALINPAVPTGGFHPWSTGYLQYAFDEPGLSGVIGPEFSFYDPFDMESCGMLNPMRCLDVERRLIAYRHDAKMHYFLQWMQPGNEDSAWNLYQATNDNFIELLETNTGMAAYRAYLQRKGMSSSDVLWGTISR